MISRGRNSKDLYETETPFYVMYTILYTVNSGISAKIYKSRSTLSKLIVKLVQMIAKISLKVSEKF